MDSKKTIALRDLLASIDCADLLVSLGIPANEEVTGVVSDSRQVGPGKIFIAVRGASQDGHDHVASALEAGAILCIGELPLSLAKDSNRYLQVSDSRGALARLASRFHGDPSSSMKIVGVTGTSGKTTTTYIIEAILKAAGHRVGVIGTVNFRIGDQILPSTHTTPGAVELQELLGLMKDQGCTAVVMEVSSHALKQRRSDAIAFDGMVFTNLSPEHLDFHPDMEDYFCSKRRLFTDYRDFSSHAGKTPVLSVNADDLYGQRLLRETQGRGYGLTHALGQPVCLRFSVEGIEGEIQGQSFRSGLAGRFNASNIIAAWTVCADMGISSSVIARGIASLEKVPGRLERVRMRDGTSGSIEVLVDYAHKPDALENVLKTLDEVKKPGQRLITVMGCGGDRDRTKRPVMGALATRWSDHVVVTSDNPRTENPEAILSQIVAGIPPGGSYSVEIDRRKAIFEAIILRARSGDLVLIAGKGHEDYQMISDPSAQGGVRKIHFDDREVAREALEFRSQNPST